MTRTGVIVETVKAEYPKFSKAALSLASRSYETGVTFTPRARELKDAAERATTPHRRRRGSRRKSIAFRCRLSPADASRVKRAMEAEGLIMQDLLETLLMEWVKEQEPLPGVATEERQEIEAVRPGFASEYIAND